MRCAGLPGCRAVSPRDRAARGRPGQDGAQDPPFPPGEMKPARDLPRVVPSGRAAVLPMHRSPGSPISTRLAIDTAMARLSLCQRPASEARSGLVGAFDVIRGGAWLRFLVAGICMPLPRRPPARAGRRASITPARNLLVLVVAASGTCGHHHFLKRRERFAIVHDRASRRHSYSAQDRKIV